MVDNYTTDAKTESPSQTAIPFGSSDTLKTLLLLLPYCCRKEGEGKTSFLAASHCSFIIFDEGYISSESLCYDTFFSLQGATCFSVLLQYIFYTATILEFIHIVLGIPLFLF